MVREDESEEVIGDDQERKEYSSSGSFGIYRSVESAVQISQVPIEGPLGSMSMIGN